MVTPHPAGGRPTDALIPALPRRPPLFRVLGELGAGTDAVPQRAPGRHRARLLLMLLCSANRPVSVEELVEGVWAGRPPRSAPDNLRMLVLHWRRVLPVPADGRPRITKSFRGYAVAVARDELDAFVFEDLTLAAVRAAADGDPRTAEPLFREALQLWRGDPYDDLPSAADQQGVLRDLRHLAEAGLVETLLALGRPAEAVPLLRSLTAANPCDERSWERLMIALNGSGRRGDALTAYREAGTVLDRDLGVLPGRRLRELRRQLESPGG